MKEPKTEIFFDKIDLMDIKLRKLFRQLSVGEIPLNIEVVSSVFRAGFCPQHLISLSSTRAGYWECPECLPRIFRLLYLLDATEWLPVCPEVDLDVRFQEILNILNGIFGQTYFYTSISKLFIKFPIWDIFAKLIIKYMSLDYPYCRSQLGSFLNENPIIIETATYLFSLDGVMALNEWIYDFEHRYIIPTIEQLAPKPRNIELFLRTILARSAECAANLVQYGRLAGQVGNNFAGRSSLFNIPEEDHYSMTFYSNRDCWWPGIWLPDDTFEQSSDWAESEETYRTIEPYKIPQDFYGPTAFVKATDKYITAINITQSYYAVSTTEDLASGSLHVKAKLFDSFHFREDLYESIARFRLSYPHIHLIVQDIDKEEEENEDS
jgi:hypothetical protein